MDSDGTKLLEAHDLPLRSLVGEIAGAAARLAAVEVELAKTELKADARAELTVVKGLSVALVAGIVGATILLMAAVLALAQVMPGWLAALIVGGVVLAAGAAAG